jgi:hypothetical protein
MDSTILPRGTILINALALGGVIGTLALGVGGRILMRLYAWLSWQEPAFTVVGSLTVVFLGTCYGMATGFLLWLARRLFPGSRMARTVLFWAGLLLLSWHALTPLSLLRAEVFGPLVVIYGVALSLTFYRRFPITNHPSPLTNVSQITNP